MAEAADIPAGYGFDYASADVILTRLSVDAGGRITTPSGMSYRLLALDPRCQRMSLPVLSKLRDLVKAGASIVGPKPTESPSLSDSQAEFRSIAGELWASAAGINAVGKGSVYAGQTVAEALAALKISPDFECAMPQADTSLMFVHRKLNDGDFYWVNNRSSRPESLDATFRIQGKAAELWHDDTRLRQPSR